MKKLLQFPLVCIISACVFLVGGIAAGQVLLGVLRSMFSITSAAPANLLAFFLISPAVYVAYRLYVRLVEKRPASEVGVSGALREFGAGALLGFGLFALVIGILWLAGAYRVTGFHPAWLVVLGAAAGAFASALAQELIFRASIFRITEGWLGTWWALVVSALLFGLIHLSQANATLFSTIAIAVQAGVMLAAAYTLTHRIWMAVGLHMAWDFANDGIFGAGVAGQTGQSLPALLQAKLSGPTLLTGGAPGVEASLTAVILTTAAGIVLLWIAYRRGMFVPTPRRMQIERAQVNASMKPD
jgi:membrane protease YdiL (CAAX protease family)